MQRMHGEIQSKCIFIVIIVSLCKSRVGETKPYMSSNYSFVYIIIVIELILNLSKCITKKTRTSCGI